MTDGQGAPTEKIGVVVIHGVGETRPGWINEFLVPQLSQREPQLAFAPCSEVYTLPEPLRSEPGHTFDTFVRRARHASGREVSLIEMYWGDLSRTGEGTLASLLASLKLFYEAPLVLGGAFLQQSFRGEHGFLRWLILFSNWLLRWPITGVSTAALVASLVMLAIGEAGGRLAFLRAIPMDFPVAATLLVLASLALMSARHFAHREIALAEISMSTAICSFGLLALLIAYNVLVVQLRLLPLGWGWGPLDGPAPILHAAYWFIFPLWWVWNHAVVIAILVLFLQWLGRLATGGRRSASELRRPAAALGLTTAQGVIWKIVIVGLWAILVPALVPGARSAGSCGGDPHCAFLHSLVDEQLINITLFNVLMALILGLAYFAIAGLRTLLRLVSSRALLAQRLELPRLVVSPVVIFLMFLLTLVNFYSYFAPPYLELAQMVTGTEFQLWIDPYRMRKTWLDIIQEMAALATASAIVTYFRLLPAALDSNRGLLHVMRDLVDHQYTPQFAWATGLLRTRDKREGYPRRQRVQSRLDLVMEAVVAPKGFDRIVLIGHSQGSVILHDYLASQRDDVAPAGVRRIDVVTLASPLTHLYQHYFRSYETKVMSREELNPKLASWTNLWRIDDPIGHRVGLVKGGFVVNEALAAGGHTNYWKEDRVCQTILDLIDLDRGRRPGEAVASHQLT